ncbi:uncharacterized protein LOC123307864 isoform X3 [Coccinella septempunctata]|nr:uncharacterized protein LOC123307864 isoform X3 [Coccinella septempunctata]
MMDISADSPFERSSSSNTITASETEKAMMDVSADSPSFKNYGDHFYDEEPLSNHGYALAKMILQAYFKIRIFHEVSSSNDEKFVRVRSRLTKTILFKNQ